MPDTCPSCHRRYDTMHPDYRGRTADGRMAHLELDPDTGATVLLIEAPEEN